MENARIVVVLAQPVCTVCRVGKDGQTIVERIAVARNSRSAGCPQTEPQGVRRPMNRIRGPELFCAVARLTRSHCAAHRNANIEQHQHSGLLVSLPPVAHGSALIGDGVLINRTGCRHSSTIGIVMARKRWGVLMGISDERWRVLLSWKSRSVKVN